MRRALPLLAVAACADESLVFDSLATDAAPPPLVLNVSPVIPGHDLVLEADGAPPGTFVSFARGTGQGQTCPPQLAPECLSIANAALIGFNRADANGHAELTVAVPTAARVGSSVPFQAAIGQGGPFVSNVVIRRVTSECGDGILQGGEACDDGNLLPGDGCDAQCQIETGPQPLQIGITSARIAADPPGPDNTWDDYAFVLPFTNPDVYVEIQLNGVIIGRTTEEADTLRPVWNALATLNVGLNDSLTLAIYDGDIAPLPDQLIRSFTLSGQQLFGMVGAGPQHISGGPVLDFVVEIDTP